MLDIKEHLVKFLLKLTTWLNEDRVYGALGGSLMKIYSEESGGDDPDPPPSFNLEDFKRNTIHPNFFPVQSTVTMYENIPYGDHPLENFEIL